MNHGVDTLHGQAQPVTIPHVTDKKTQFWILFVRIALSHLVLLELIPRIDNNTAYIGMPLEKHMDELLTKGTGAASDQNRI
jgi:hypothetical protein